MTKKRYTKKKKSIKDPDTNDIPYTKVRVEWVDALSDSAWASEKEFKNSQQEHTNSYDLTEIEPGGRLPGSLDTIDKFICIK